MISESKKAEIVSVLIREKEHLGSMNNVAKKLEVSPATISHNLLKSENWRSVSESKWADIAARLGVSLIDRQWNIVPTANYKMMARTLSDAQREGMFMAVSEKAGSGKTAAITDYVKNSPDHSAYFLQCEEWSRKGFLLALCAQLGVSAGKYDSMDILADHIVRFFKQRSKQVLPLLILDEADKLRPAALRFLILLYNRLEDEIGLVACGTDNLEKEIKRGVKRADKGYDEIDSRLGRSFVRLRGTSREDVAMICKANGVTDEGAIARIFADCDPFHKMIGTKYVEIIPDVRAVKRKIKRELLKLKKAA